MRRTRSAWLRTSRRFSSSIASKAPPSSSTSASSAVAASASSAVLASITTDPSKMSSYSSRSDSKASTCCIRSDHCWSHGRGNPSASFQAGSCSARARALLERVTPSDLEDDALHVVLRLLLGQPEGVDLHAVAKTAELGVLDPVALAADAVPQLVEGPHFAGLLDEADAGVHEEADATDHGGQLGLGDLARGAHAVEHADGGGERVGDLLHRRRPGLLEVVAAHVDRVPPGRVAHGVGDGVDGEPQARARAGRCRSRGCRYSLTMSFCVVPDSSAGSTPWSCAWATYSASNHAAVALIVMDVFMFSTGMPSRSSVMWPRWATGTPTLPTSPAASGASGS